MTTLSFPFENPPPPGQRQLILPGLDWVRMPLPFALDHVNCWILDGDDRVLIDTAVSNDTCRRLWEQHFSDGWPDHLLVTHYHPDHAGLARWFAQKNVTVHGNDVEMRLSADIWSIEDEHYGGSMAVWFAENGIEPSRVAAVRAAGNTYRRLVEMPVDRWYSLQSGQEVTLAGRPFTVLTGRGHAPEMVMLYQPDAHLLIAADQVLPGISPNVSLGRTDVDGDPLGDYLETLKELRALPEQTFVLPSHGRPFQGLHQRLDELAEHHEDRLGKVLDACRTPQSAAALFPVLFNRELDSQQLFFALGESLSHVRHLEKRGELTRELSNGVWRYSSTG